MQMEFGIFVAYNWREVLANVKALDESNFSALYMPDHPTMDAPDGWTFLAYLAGQTKRLRLGSHVTCASLHQPAELAKQVVTVDVLSDGRAALGIQRPPDESDR